MECVSIGSTHVLATTSQGRAFCWGAGLSGQLGLGDGRTIQMTPKVIPQFADSFIVSAHCAMTHSVFIMSDSGHDEVVTGRGHWRTPRSSEDDADVRGRKMLTGSSVVGSLDTVL